MNGPQTGSSKGTQVNIDDLKKLEDIEKLNKEIADLTQRKNDIKAEIDKAVAEAVVAIEEKQYKLFEDKISELEADYQKKARLYFDDKDKETSQSLAQKTAGLEEDFKKLGETLTENFQKKIEEALNHYAALEEKIKAYLKEEQGKLDVRGKEINARETSVNNLAVKNTEREKELEAREITISNAESSRARLEADQGTKEANLNAREDNINKKDLVSQDREDKSFALKNETDKGYLKLQEDIDELSRLQAEVNAEKEKNINEGKKLSEWRDALNEKETTLREKEKMLILKEREIDEKIRTLQKLREGGK